MSDISDEDKKAIAHESILLVRGLLDIATTIQAAVTSENDDLREGMAIAAVKLESISELLSHILTEHAGVTEEDILRVVSEFEATVVTHKHKADTTDPMGTERREKAGEN